MRDEGDDELGRVARGGEEPSYRDKFKEKSQQKASKLEKSYRKGEGGEAD